MGVGTETCVRTVTPAHEEARRTLTTSFKCLYGRGFTVSRKPINRTRACLKFP